MGRMPIEALGGLPATTYSALCAAHPDGYIQPGKELVDELIGEYRVSAGAVVAALAINAPKPLRLLWSLAKRDIAGVSMPPDLASAVQALEGCATAIVDLSYAHNGAPIVAALDQIGTINTFLALFANLVVESQKARDAADRGEPPVWTWEALAFAEVAFSRVMMARSGLFNHRELEILVDHYADCMGNTDDDSGAALCCVLLGYTQVEGVDEHRN
jgi:hypothetical protein